LSLSYWSVNPENLSVLAFRREGDGFGRVREYRAGEDLDSAVPPAKFRHLIPAVLVA